MKSQPDPPKNLPNFRSSNEIQKELNLGKFLGQDFGASFEDDSVVLMLGRGVINVPTRWLFRFFCEKIPVCIYLIATRIPPGLG